MSSVMSPELIVVEFRAVQRMEVCLIARCARKPTRFEPFVNVQTDFVEKGCCPIASGLGSRL